MPLPRFPWPWHFPWWPHHKDNKDDVIIPHPCVLVPGIGGSILHAVPVDSSQNWVAERVWVRLFKADAQFREKIWSLYNKESGKTESLDKKTKIVVPEDRFGLYSCDILDPDLPLYLDTVSYYHELIHEMLSWGYKEGTSLFGFGFDFRQSNRLDETLDLFTAKLKGIYEATNKKVDIISHSMGGLLIKSYLTFRKAEFELYVNKWITIASPFRGAPGFIIDTLLTGVDFVKGWKKSLFVAKWSMHQLVMECPSIYEMMADPKFPWQEAPELRIWRQKEGDKEPHLQCSPPDTTFDVMAEALEKNVMQKDGKTIPLPLNQALVEHAADTKAAWESAAMPAGVHFYNIYGTSLDTPFHVTYGSQAAPLKDLAEILDTDAVFVPTDGDGTVPLESAKADGLHATLRIGLPGEHRGIIKDPHVFRILRHWLRVGKFDPLYDPYCDAILVPPSAVIEREMEAAAAKAQLLRQQAALGGFATEGAEGGPQTATAAIEAGSLSISSRATVTCDSTSPKVDAWCCCPLKAAHVVSVVKGGQELKQQDKTAALMLASDAAVHGAIVKALDSCAVEGAAEVKRPCQ